jgi:hypothetical protein
MADYYFSARLDNGAMLCLAPLTERRIELSGEVVPDASGYFLYSMRGADDFQDVEILAHVASEEAAWQLKAMLNLE